MSFINGRHTGSTPTLHHSNSNRSLNIPDDVSARSAREPSALGPEAPADADDNIYRTVFADLYRKTEDRVALLFGDSGHYNRDAIDALRRTTANAETGTPTVLPPTTDHEDPQEPPRKKAKRDIDEDDYGDDDEDDGEGDGPSGTAAAKTRTSAAGALLSPSKSGSSPVQSVNSPDKQLVKVKIEPSTQSQEKDAGNDAIKTLEEEHMAAEEAARRSFHTILYTLENDRAAMLEQQRLEDSEKQLQAEMDHNTNPNATGQAATNQGSLASANLGASSLTLKHLIARIDMRRDEVEASDAELRTLMNEVRKNRSKWASEENVNQEELYEALEKVLTELKAHTEYSTPFLTRVMIKNPMDLGTMTKKLKTLSYKSKDEFVTDLNLVWDNCLRYNQDMNHPLRRMANGMRKEAEKLIPLIPDLVIRSRAEVEAEERRKQNGGEDDAADDSDDEPIMSSRGRVTGTKGASVTANKSRKAPSEKREDTPVVDQKPVLQVNGLLGKHGRENSEAVEGSNGFGTPPIGGSNTPAGIHGASGVASNADAMDVDGPSLNGLALDSAYNEAVEQAFEDEEYKIWKQTTKKDRALAAKERHFLFKDNKLNLEATAALRTKAAMRRFLKHQQEAATLGSKDAAADDAGASTNHTSQKPAETLAEGIDEEVERVIPDHYDALSNIPDIQANFRWIEDGEGHVINQHEDFLRLAPEGAFRAPQSRLSKKIDDNIHQIQETRKLVNKISVIKQMQVQTQVFSNQFPKINSEGFHEQDIEPHFIADNGPVMAAETCHDALRRSVTKILYHTGFEETQPSAVDAFTDIVADYFQKLVKTFSTYTEVEQMSVVTKDGTKVESRYTPEEAVLHTLDENGYDVEALDTYVKDDLDRQSSKLATMHDRMKNHLTDLLRPALTGEEGTDGVGAFKDGSDTFVSGDFADDLGEDFFGFKALGLDGELGGALAVPFHLLQTRVRNQYQMQTQTAGPDVADLFEPPEPLEPITKGSIQGHIGLVKNFFWAKLHANGDQPLVEDEDLPVKQRKPRPRLGATGKIVSAQKRPPKEQLALAKKKKKLEAAAAEAKLNASPGKAGSASNTPMKKKSLPNGTMPNPAVLALAPSMERSDSMQSQGGASQTDKDEGTGMMSPESIAQ
ncbi:Transcriptional activator-like protein [Emericellopsis cladophorae]|uniref:Transcriptional activator-like protein n=1 Tax=Emericellopsis cladophorae TaxID=2686198 RepID=A0A9P9XUX8_9HYPO|nr:Transcriptional activator-like protein [Emericellopsis cladophorae]KAI6777930.1 Transcriptional activator-like protein [Emericellopsis cladophorae]